MRVLLLFPMANGQTGPAIKYAFEQLGHEVRSVDAKLQPEDSYKVAYDFEPDLIFCSRTQALTWKVTEIKAKFKNAIACMWNTDMRPSLKKWEPLFPLIKSCDYHFIPDTGTLSKWKSINPNTFWLPQGLQDEIYDKPKKITDEDKAKYSCDISFAGDSKSHYHKHRNQYLNVIRKMGLKLKLWGCEGNPKVYNEEHNKMVSLSKINLCLTYDGMKRCTSVRNYKILGAGGFALELYREEVDKIFPSHVLNCFTSPEDFEEKIKYWLNHDWERRQIVAMAYKWVHENATYTHRIRMALNYMRELDG